jgi:hypothetical protein
LVWEGRPVDPPQGYSMRCADGWFEIVRGQFEGGPELPGKELK